jgi:DNA-binding CsgD family transcriptional regulator
MCETVGSARWSPAACLRDADEAKRLAVEADWAAGQIYADLQASVTLVASGELGQGLDRLGRALDMAMTIDHRQWVVAAHIFLGQAHVLLLAPGAARAHLQVALATARDLGSDWWIAVSTTYLALAHLQDGDDADAEVALAALLSPEAAVALAQGSLQERRLAWAWSEVRLAQDRPAEALALADALLRSAPGGGPIPALLTVRGEALLALGRADEAARALDDAVRGAQARHERPRLWRSHAARAALCRARGQHREARRAAEDARAAIEDLAASVPEGPLRDGFCRAALARLPDLVHIAPAPIGLPFGLTGREVEVLRLVARGLSNSAIADRLSLSRRTVEQHLRNAYDKLGVDNRTAAVRAVVEHGLA